MLLGVDIGTSSSKGVLVGFDGTIVRKAERAHGISTPRPGWVEQDAESVWWADFVTIVRLLVDSDTRIDAVGLSAIDPCLLPADASERPLRRGILYGIVTRATAEVADLTEELGADQFLARAGSALNTQALGPRLRWLARHEPEVYSKTEMLLMASSYLVYRLTGRYVLDHHSASKCNPIGTVDEQRNRGRCRIPVKGCRVRANVNLSGVRNTLRAMRIGYGRDSTRPIAWPASYERSIRTTAEVSATGSQPATDTSHIRLVT